MGLVNIRKATIVLVDSDSSFRQSLAQFLQKSGFSTVITLENAQSTIAQLKQTKADVLVMGNNLPDIPAVQLLKALRASKKRLPVVFISSSESDDYRSEALEAGADLALARPISNKELLQALDQFMLKKMGITSPAIGSE
jgi:DNA-binding NarL/FixJ family response regulator